MSEYIIAHCVDIVSGVRYDERREEIVRCRDCYYADEFEGGYWCASGDIPFAHVTPNGFCSWGARREQ